MVWFIKHLKTWQVFAAALQKQWKWKWNMPKVDNFEFSMENEWKAVYYFPSMAIICGIWLRSRGGSGSSPLS